MTNAEYIASIEVDPNVFEIIENVVLNNLSDTAKEYIVRYLEKDESDKVSMISKQYYIINDTYYERA